MVEGRKTHTTPGGALDNIQHHLPAVANVTASLTWHQQGRALGNGTKAAALEPTLLRGDAQELMQGQPTAQGGRGEQQH